MEGRKTEEARLNEGSRPAAKVLPALCFTWFQSYRSNTYAAGEELHLSQAWFHLSTQTPPLFYSQTMWPWLKSFST